MKLLTSLLFTLYSIIGLSQPLNWKVTEDKDTTIALKEGDSIRIHLVGFTLQDTFRLRNQVLKPCADSILVIRMSPNQATIEDCIGNALDIQDDFQLICNRVSNQITKLEIRIDKSKNKLLPNSDLRETSIYYDALILINGSSADKDKIFNKYGLSIDTDNPYLTEIIRDQQVADVSSKLGTISSYIGGLDVTKYADGLAKFLVNRAKQELAINFFDNFRDELNKEKYIDVRTLFPASVATLNLIGEEIYNYSQYLQSLRQSFEHDFHLLPDHLPLILNNRKEFFDKRTDLASAIRVGSKIAVGLRDKEHPGSIINGLDVKQDFKGFSDTLQSSINLVKELSEGLRDTVKGQDAPYWVKREHIKKLYTDTKFLKIFAGLLAENVKADTILYNFILNEERLEKVETIIGVVSDQTTRINHLLSAENNSEKSGVETVITYVDAAVDLVESAQNTYKAILPNSKDHSPLDTLLIIVKETNDLVSNINRGHYSEAIFNLAQIFNTLSRPSANIPEDQIKKVQALGKELRKIKDSNGIKDLATENLEFLTALKDSIIVTDKEVVAWLIRYGTFMAAMVEAENSDDVASAIEAVALPTGSARIKRNSAYNIALNGYLGFSGGLENSDFVLSLSAPLGISFSTSRDGLSFSLFASIIDVGAISAFRFTNDTDSIPKIYLQEIFSPGAFLSIGLPRSPISISAGYQKIPLLQKVGLESNDVSIQRIGRVSLGVLVDIPILNLANRRHRKSYG